MRELVKKYVSFIINDGGRRSFRGRVGSELIKKNKELLEKDLISIS